MKGSILENNYSKNQGNYFIFLYIPNDLDLNVTHSLKALVLNL